MYKIILLASLLICTHAQAQKKILIAYHSESGNTTLMADAVAKGAKSVEGIEVVMKNISAVTQNELIESDAIILGTPVHNSTASSAMIKFIESWPFENQPLKNKIGAAFVTAGGISAGEELTQIQLLQSMLVFGMIVVGGDDWTSAFGASAITDEAPFKNSNKQELNNQFTHKAFLLGKRVATVTKAFRNPIMKK